MLNWFNKNWFNKTLLNFSELRVRIFYTLSILAIYRLGIYVTTPGVDRTATRGFLKTQEMQGGGFLSLFNFFSGGALENASIFALGIMPYITSSIVMTIISVVIPRIERMQKEGEEGRKKINQYIRYGTVIVSIVQGTMIAQSFRVNGVVNSDWINAYWGVGFIAITALSLTAGTILIMWLGEQITEWGIGNGISLIIFSGIVAKFPSILYSITLGINNYTYQVYEILLLGLFMIFALAGIILIEEGQRRLPVHYARRIIGNREYGGQITHLPLKINIAGVIPPIFASTVLMFPMTLNSFWHNKWVELLQKNLIPGGWHYETLFVVAIIFFSYFYAAIQFNPVDVADNLRKFGGFIPGIRPGKATSEYIDFILVRLTFVGSIYLSVICVLPALIQYIIPNKMPFYFGGTGLLIVVNVALETMRQFESHYISNEYEDMIDDKLKKDSGRIRARLQENVT